MKTPSNQLRPLVVCGGGTGGHFYSGVAVAEKFLKLYPNSSVVFVGTLYGIEARAELSDLRMSRRFILAKGVKGKGLQQKLSALVSVVAGIFQSFLLLAQIRPSMVVGVGGYASFPTVLAALLMRWLFGWKVIVLDQNSSPGIANRVFSKMPLQAYCAFPSKGFQLVDLPVRARLQERAAKRREAQWPPQTILVIGGSQGAHGLNQKWKDVLSELKSWNSNIKIFHQSGKNDEADLREAYAKQNITAEVFAFTNEVEKYLDAADLVISRSGAMTVFEILSFERPVIFVPFPKAADDHQRKNALAVQDPDWILSEEDFGWGKIKELLRSPQPKLLTRNQADVEAWDRILKLG